LNVEKTQKQALPMSSPIVFVVDKNPIHSSLIKYHLNVNRFVNVHSFHSADECLYRVQKGLKPDFLITEYHLGDLTGFDFLKTVRAITPVTHVIFFTSYDDPILAVRLLDMGASDYIIKTGKLDYGIAELIKNIKYLIKEGVTVRNI
jgi:DNA-binding response OmpR family regulator